MIFRIGFKTPDAVDYATEDVPEEEMQAVKSVIAKWVKYGECITVEVDTEKETCTVLPV
jgi:hypothetical protein